MTLGTTEAETAQSCAAEPSPWKRRYRDKHLPRRVTAWPAGVQGPQKVRVYARNGHWLLQWWDRGPAHTFDRVEGDLIDALARARRIDQRLINYRTAGTGKSRVHHAQLVAAFLQDFQKRADAGTIACSTPRRYRSALAKYLNYVEQPEVHCRCPYAERADRELALGFAAYLQNLLIHPNGRSGAMPRRIRGQSFVLDAVRAMFEWAADPQRGNLLAEGFRNPFGRGVLPRRVIARDPVGEPDITVAMAAQFLAECDDYQRRLFAPMILYPMRAAEPVMLFHEMLDAQFIRVLCIEGLDYVTKGRRDKLLPLLPPVEHLLRSQPEACRGGLLYLRRAVLRGTDKPPLCGATLEQLIEEYQRRCNGNKACTAAARSRIRQEVIHDAGGLTYKLIQTEFKAIARKLAWPKEATLKDFRHLANTMLMNAGLSQEERRYLMGQSLGRSALINYTHLNRLKSRYAAAVEQEFAPVLAALCTPPGQPSNA